MDEEIIKQVVSKILADSTIIMVDGLKGITREPSFDVGKIDYVIDRDTLQYRIEYIVRGIISLAIPAITDLVEKKMEAKVRMEIKSMI